MDAACKKLGDAGLFASVAKAALDDSLGCKDFLYAYICPPASVPAMLLHPGAGHLQWPSTPTQPSLLSSHSWHAMYHADATLDQASTRVETLRPMLLTDG